MIFTIDGTDGSGKTTVAKQLAKDLKIGYLHFPFYENETGQMILKYLNKEVSWDALSFQCLQICNRIQLIETLRLYKENERKHIILDRYNPSSIVYGQLFGIDKHLTYQLCSILPKSDLEIIVISDKPYRLNGDVHETIDNWKKTKEFYLEYYALNTSRCVVAVQNNSSIEECIKECSELINEKLWHEESRIINYLE